MSPAIHVGARSRFVTSIAWVFIALAALASALAVLAPGQALSQFVPWLAGHLPWVVAAGIGLAVATLASAIGLLLRLDWARRSFIGLLALAIVAHLLGLWLQQEVMQSVVHETLSTTVVPVQVLGVFGGFVTAARVMAGLLTLAACALLAWIIRRLMAEAVRQEFG